MEPLKPIEKHPLKPFLPDGARLLMLGSFPPKRERWSMDFFYPNWINDMWRIVGLLFFSDKNHFVVESEKRFDKERIVDFCSSNGLALYDSASAVRRLQDNASDKFLEVVVRTDIGALLDRCPTLGAIVTTGEKATDQVVEQFACEKPKVGEWVEFLHRDRPIRFWRMPSSSRAYPLSIEKKAQFYGNLFRDCRILG